MRKSKWLISLAMIVISTKGFAAPRELLIDQLQSQRQAFAGNDKIDLRRFSLDIQAAVREANALDQVGNDAGAVARLQALTQYAPLTQLPSFDVQSLCDRLYTKLSKSDGAAGCRDRAAALTEILHNRSGSGVSPDDPVQVITINEIAEWNRSLAGTITNISGYPYHGENLQAITYHSSATGGRSTVAYFKFTPRLSASINNATPDPFAPLPVSQSDGKYQSALTEAHEQRVEFLNDLTFNYPELIRLCNDTTREAMQLAQRGDYNAALSKLGEVERIRPIRQIPIFGFISVYSFLLGKVGNVDAQSKMRLYLFGISQDIAHSGDGLTQESAVHVVAISEEYAWVGAKKMHVVKQMLIRNGERRYDVLDAIGANGNTQTYYFDVSQLFGRESPLSQ